MSKCAVGRSWEDFEKEIYTEDEIAASDLRVAQISEMIKTGEQQDIISANTLKTMDTAVENLKLR